MPNHAIQNQQSWSVVNSGRLSGQVNMHIDQEQLALSPQSPCLRFFQWTEQTISYGYLLNLTEVQHWAQKNFPHKQLPLVQRPTAGGVVCHETSDLSVSLLWPKGSHVFPEKPRDCYEAIHKILKEALVNTIHQTALELYMKPIGSCEPAAQGNFSVCYQKPVCNDVMLGEEKIIGGALRLTKTSILYQGNIRLKDDRFIDSLILNITKKLS